MSFGVGLRLGILAPTLKLNTVFSCPPIRTRRARERYRYMRVLGNMGDRESDSDALGAEGGCIAWCIDPRDILGTLAFTCQHHPRGAEATTPNRPSQKPADRLIHLGQVIAPLKNHCGSARARHSRVSPAFAFTCSPGCSWQQSRAHVSPCDLRPLTIS